MRNRSFSFDPTNEEYAAYYTQVSPIELWHKRLGHCHLERMLDMKKKDLAKGLPEFSDNLPNCNACQFGKQIKKSFSKSAWRASQKLQLKKRVAQFPLIYTSN